MAIGYSLVKTFKDSNYYFELHIYLATVLHSLFQNIIDGRFMSFSWQLFIWLDIERAMTAERNMVIDLRPSIESALAIGAH